MNRNWWWVAIAFLVIAIPALRGEDDPKPKPKSDDKPRPDQKATLAGAKGFERTTGSVRYRDRPEERELDVEVEKVPLPRGTVLNVQVNGIPVGTITLGFLHGGKLKLRWNDKKEDDKKKERDVIPFVTIGSNVTVRTAQQVVANGRF